MIVVYENGDCRVVTRKVTLQNCLQNVSVAIPLIAGATITDIQVPVGYLNASTNVWHLGDYCKKEATTYTFTFKLCIDDVTSVAGNYPIVISTDTIQDVSDDNSDVLISVECKEPTVTVTGSDPGDCDECDKIPSINPNFPNQFVEDVDDCDVPSEPSDPCNQITVDENLCLTCEQGQIVSKCEEGYTCNGKGECIQIVLPKDEEVGDGSCHSNVISGSVVEDVDSCDVP